MTERPAVRDAIVALSLANLSLIEVWNALLNYTPAQSFFFDHAPTRSQYAAALADVFLIGLVFFLLIHFARWIGERFGWKAFVCISIPILFVTALPAAKAIVRTFATRYPAYGPRGVIEILLGVVVVFALISRRKFFAYLAILLLTLAPLIAVEAMYAVSEGLADRSAAFADRPAAARLPANGGPRVVWIIFDELDYRLLFPGRPAGLAMPEFDRLQTQSIFADHAVSPALDTIHSLPSLITAKPLVIITPTGPASALFDGTPVSKEPNIFSSLHDMGFNSAVTGWYLPYCRIFGQDLADCSWHEIDNIVAETEGSFVESAARQAQSLFEYGFLSVFPESLRARHRIHMVRSMIAEGERYTGDPSLNFVFLHLPVPHPPHFYDRLTRTFTKHNAGPSSYPDSLALADTILGDLREAMTRAGLWDKTTVVVSSDHPNRSAILFDGKTDPRVPFLVKFAGQTSGVNYSAPFRTINTKPLVEAIFKHQIQSTDDAVKWLAAHPN